MTEKPLLTVERCTTDDGEGVLCAACAEYIDEGDDVVWEPSPHIAPNAVEMVHPACAVSNGYRLEWREP